MDTQTISARRGRSVAALVRLLIVPCCATLLGACATTGATFRSGVGDRMLEHPPYYAGKSAESVARDAGRVGHLPVALQRGASQVAIFDPRDASGSPVDMLLGDMNAYLDSIGVSVRIIEGRGAPAIPQVTAGAPDVRFGCLPELGIPGNDCAERGDSALGRGYQAMSLSVGRPSREWVSWVGDAMKAKETDRTLVITLEVGQYLIRQQGLRGSKIVELGTGNTASLPWLTSLETPVMVLQLTGALIDADGRAVRIGSEGFYHRRTPLVVSAAGAQQLLTDEDVSAAAESRREDLPGRPLAWRVALRELVVRLTGNTQP